MQDAGIAESLPTLARARGIGTRMAVRGPRCAHPIACERTSFTMTTVEPDEDGFGTHRLKGARVLACCATFASQTLAAARL